MLDKKDTDIVKEWLTLALINGAEEGITKANLAEYCGVKPQAVDGWLTTGRIRKANLQKASERFGHAPSFTYPGVSAQQSTAFYGQPATVRARALEGPPPKPNFTQASVSESEWATLQDIAVLPHDEQEALRHELRTRAAKYRAYMDQVLAARGAVKKEPHS